jgi:hypothetical protein
VTGSLSLRVYTGASAGTESSAQTHITLTDTDTLGSGGIVPGTYSFERWLRLRIDSPPPNGVTNFWLQNEGALPADVILRFGITDLPATPVATQSLIATMGLTSGRHFIFDTNTYTAVGETSRYVVLQLQALVTADTGSLPQQTPSFGWSET